MPTETPVPESPTAAVRLIGRGGLIAYGIVHVLVGVLAVRIAFGAPAEAADKKGALDAVAENGFGVALLWVVTVGLAALVLWQLGEAVFSHRGVPTGPRILRTAINLAEAALFGVLAYSAGKVAAAGGEPSTEPTVASKVLELPGGNLLVGAAGVGLIVGAAYAVYHGVTHAFLRDLDLRGAGLRRSTLVTRIGQVGWTALGLVYVVPGVLLIVAAARYDPNQPTGMDAGLRAVAAEPYGPPLLVALALGLLAFGVTCLFDARYRRA